MSWVVSDERMTLPLTVKTTCHPRPSLISYRHETDKSDNRIIGPKLIEPVMIKLITQP